MLSPEQWNALVPPGTPIRYWYEGGTQEYLDTKTRSLAYFIDACTCVLLEGVGGPVSAEFLAVRAVGMRPEIELWEDHAKWSQATLGTDSERGPVGPLEHLKREADEAIEAPAQKRPGEIADCLLLVLDAARRSGMSWDDLWQAAADKLEVNKGRKWRPMDTDGMCEHEREADDG